MDSPFPKETISADFCVVGGGIAGIQTALDIAAEENFPIFFMDEVAFRHGSAAQKIDVSVKRITDFIKKYGSHPGFYKIDGKPFYYSRPTAGRCPRRKSSGCAPKSTAPPAASIGRCSAR